MDTVQEAKKVIKEVKRTDEQSQVTVVPDAFEAKPEVLKREEPKGKVFTIAAGTSPMRILALACLPVIAIVGYTANLFHGEIMVLVDTFTETMSQPLPQYGKAKIRATSASIVVSPSITPVDEKKSTNP